MRHIFVAATAIVALAAGADVRAGEPPGGDVTFSHDIAPIVFAKCGVCHRRGGSAPFSLLTYDAARQHASQMAEATAAGFMPPWKADDGPGQAFIGQPHLTAAETAMFARWAREGAVEGDPGDLPPQPQWTDGWQLGAPDLVVSPRAYTLEAEGTDVFRVFVIPLPVDGVRFVRGMEFHPGNARVVHHANIRIDRTSASRQFDEGDPTPGYEGLIARSAVYPDGHFLGWTPGQVPPLLPKGLAWRLEPGTDLVVELHMQPSGRDELVQPRIGFFFGSDPPGRTPVMLRLGRQNIDIAAGDSHYVVTDSFVLPVPVEIEAVQPHAHYRARDITGSATLPDGTTRRLIHIGDWDFRWQHVYRYVTPFTLPRGTTLSMRYVYDNSAGNPRNPSQPPRHVTWGQRSGDEMGDLWIQVLPNNDHDRQVLDDAFRPKVLAEDVVGYEQWIRTEPQRVALHDDVAVLYLGMNRPEDAVRHFAISARLKPGVAAAHFNLGTALTVAGRLDEAIAEYRRALAIDPDYAQAHNNMGSILLRTGKPVEALEHLTHALRINPSNPQALYNVAAAYAALGDFDRAVQAAERAVAAAPGSDAIRHALQRYRRGLR
jgi:cytochrome c-type biogenesis protein CcmH/NrfG